MNRLKKLMADLSGKAKATAGTESAALMLAAANQLEVMTMEIDELLEFIGDINYDPAVGEVQTEVSDKLGRVLDFIYGTSLIDHLVEER